MAPRAGTGHDNHCMPNPNPFPILLERLDGIEAIGQEIFDDSRGVKPGLCWSTIYESLLECRGWIEVELSSDEGFHCQLAIFDQLFEQ